MSAKLNFASPEPRDRMTYFILVGSVCRRAGHGGQGWAGEHGGPMAWPGSRGDVGSTHGVTGT